MRSARVIAVVALMLIGRAAVACYAHAGPAVTACPGMVIDLPGSGSGVGTLTYTWFPATGLSDPHVAQPHLTVPATTTTYTLSVTDASGCTANDHVTVTVTACPDALLEAGTDVQTTTVNGMPAFVYCDGQPQWAFSLTDATPDLTGAVRTIDPGDGTAPQTIAHGGTFAHTYGSGDHVLSYTIALPGGWSTTTQYLAYVGAAPAPPVVSTNSPVCIGQTLSVSTAAEAGVSYTWTGPDGFTTDQPGFVRPGANAAMAGTYELVTRRGACAGPATALHVEVTAPPVVAVQPVAAEICAGESISLQASGAMTYAWSQGAQPLGTGDAIDLQPTATMYVVLTGESNGCTASTVVPVTVHPLPEVAIAPLPALCDQAVPTVLTATPAGGDWSGPYVDPAGIFTPQPGALGAFPLEYGYTDLHGCSATAQTVAVVQPIGEPATAPPAMALCAGGPPVALNGQPAGGQWGGGPVDEDGLFHPQAPGTYALTYAVGTGSCRTEAHTAITVHALPAVQAVGPPLLCADQGPQPLQGLPAGGVWSGPGTDIAGVVDPGALAPGTHSALYTWTDPATGCGNSATATFAVQHPPVAQFTLPTVACAGELLMFASAIEGTADQFAWDMGDGHTAAGAVAWYAYADPGTYTAQLTAANTCGTASTAHTLQVLHANTTAAIDPDALTGCAPFAVALASASVGDTAITWSWGGGTSTEAVLNALFTEPGSHTVQLTAVGCQTDAATVTVLVHAPPVAAITVEAGPVCTGMPIGLHDATAGTTEAAWTLGDGTTSDLAAWTHAFADAGIWAVQLVATDPATGCRDTAQYALDVPPAPQAAFTVITDPLCAGDAVQFHEQGAHGTMHAWRFGDGGTGQGTAPTHTYAEAGAYVAELVATGTGGCTDTARHAITVHGLPHAGFTHAPAGHSGLAHGFDAAGGAAAYRWTFGDGGSSTLEDPLHHFSAPGEWEVCLEVANAAGCIAVHCERVRVEGPEVVWMPSAFSPDGDGVNEKLLPVIAGGAPAAYRFTVHDRWGGVLFETADPAQGWDGTAHGRTMDAGVYVWTLEWRQGDTAQRRIGHVTVLR